jgi:hypothetical protein
LERLKKIVPKKKSINEEVHNFQNTQEEDVQVVAPLETKKKQHPKKTVVKVEKDEVDGESNISVLTMCFNSCSFQILKAKQNQKSKIK